MYVNGIQGNAPFDNEITFQCYSLNFRPQFSNELLCFLAVSLCHSLLPVVSFLSTGRGYPDSGSVVILLSIVDYNHRLAAHMITSHLWKWDVLNHLSNWNDIWNVDIEKDCAVT